LWYTNCRFSFWWIYTAVTGATEEYDGTSWATNPGSLNTARRDLAGCGTQTAALAFGGEIAAATGATEEYDGTTWTSVNSMNTARDVLGGAGTQTAALGFGGNIHLLQEQPKNMMEHLGQHSKFMNTARIRLGGAGTQPAALAFGGNDGTANTAATEEFTITGTAGIKTITVS
jgi:hypothetical protein